jgi:hypothetical protein
VGVGAVSIGESVCMLPVSTRQAIGGAGWPIVLCALLSFCFRVVIIIIASYSQAAETKLSSDIICDVQ